MPHPLIKLVALLVALTTLSGCAGEATQQSSAASSEAATPELLTEDRVREIIQASYEKFEEVGLTETVVSEGETWKLLYDPSQPYYKAGLFNQDTGANELVFETDYFTHFLAYLMMQTSGFEITGQEGSFVVIADGFSPLEYQVVDGLIVSASGIGFDWEASFEYRVDQDLQKELVVMADELVESFD